VGWCCFAKVDGLGRHVTQGFVENAAIPGLIALGLGRRAPEEELRQSGGYCTVNGCFASTVCFPTRSVALTPMAYSPGLTAACTWIENAPETNGLG